MRILLVGIACFVIFMFFYSKIPKVDHIRDIKIQLTCLTSICINTLGYTKCERISPTVFSIEERTDEDSSILILKNTKKECSI